MIHKITITDVELDQIAIEIETSRDPYEIIAECRATGYGFDSYSFTITRIEGEIE